MVINKRATCYLARGIDVGGIEDQEARFCSAGGVRFCDPFHFAVLENTQGWSWTVDARHETHS
jgi:hypothetical protein